MTSFIDGPASSAGLMLRRAPYLLRVVIDRETGKIDALDQLEDEPTETEDIHVYVLAREPFRAHICRGRGSGYYELGIYRHVPDAPVEELRETAAWRAWARERYDADIAEARIGS